MKNNTQTNQTDTATKSTKTGRKNRTKLEVKLPDSLFYTNDDLFTLNSGFVPITLRVRVKKLVAEGTIVEVGTLHRAKGRPAIVMVNSPVTKDTLKKVADAGVLLSEKHTVNVASITNDVAVKKTAETEAKAVTA